MLTWAPIYFIFNPLSNLSIMIGKIYGIVKVQGAFVGCHSDTILPLFESPTLAL
jgi:hypothetical protein